MAITILAEEEQKVRLLQHNRTLRTWERIPLVRRNLKTGWPLLQVSLYSFNSELQAYEPALGGGKCHDFYIGAFNLACLLSRIPGKLSLKVGREEVDKKRLHMEGVDLFLARFTFHHKLLGLTIASDSGYGLCKVLHIETKEFDSERLTNALLDCFDFAKKKGADLDLKDIADWDSSDYNTSYTKEQIIQSINDNVAIFSEGQIFVDLGELLSCKKDLLNRTSAFEVDPKLQDFFKRIFKVDEFMQLIQSDAFNPNYTLHELNSTAVDYVSTDEVDEQELSDEEELSHVKELSFELNFKNLLDQLKVMEKYGNSLLEVDSLKGHTAIKLVENLRNFIDEFKINALIKQPGREEINHFKVNFKGILHREDKLMEDHRKIWKPIIANILIALTGIGLVAIAVNTSIKFFNDEKIKINNTLFFAKTHGQKEIEEIEKKLDSLSNQML
ncbi:hypothetical protein [Legionella hackeliae]|uniref:Ankyrin repeat protein n=1 Tax=Legionella hackeliae TaxID=449 RepID=A0A0A8USU4_LEGHA|nr:hypothetical protein [Legionella hackeliae]KTD14093.1 Ankyrin repeat protein [Legionella hackeliae]CEK10112.1 protein of unknown function [coiled-coil] [Legionella hackeliae]STX46837.1 Ankyrin repeat protein [Legionella hackeliae]